MEETDVTIIGAGVIGLAIAAHLSHGRRIVVLERHESYGRETSSHNSGVVHAGIYYPSDWLKTTLCIEGNRLLYAWAEEHGVRAVRTGKLIIATDTLEEPALDELCSAAQTNGVPELRMLSRREVHELEPCVRAVAAMHSGTSGVIDQMGLMRSLLSEASSNGAVVAFRHSVVAIDRDAGAFALTVRDAAGECMQLRTSVLVNAAGCAADGIAAMLGYPFDGGNGTPRLRHRINKGRYYDILSPAKASMLRHLIYPLPHADRTGLGVHVTLDVDGGVHLGPDTEWLDEDAMLDYRADDTRRSAFVESARRYLPWLTDDDVMPGQVGYRAKLHGPGEPPRDFLVWHDRGYVHLGGIESPGMTASLAIARRVAAFLAAP